MSILRPPTWLERPASAVPVSTSPTTIKEVSSGARINLPSGLVPFEFNIVDLAASQTAVQLSPTKGVLTVFPGEVVAMGMIGDAPKTAGSAMFEVYVNGSPSGVKIVWPNGDNAMGSFSPGTYQFAAGAKLDVRATTDSAYAPTTTDVALMLYISLNVG